MPTFTSAQVASGRAHKPVIGNPGVCTAYGEITISANPGSGDIYELVRIPAGATVIGGWFYGSDLDTNVSPTLDLDLGWAANGVETLDADGFGNFGVLSGDAISGYRAEAGITRPFGGVLLTTGPQTFTNETIIQLTRVASAATFAAGKVWVIAHYVV